VDRVPIRLFVISAHPLYADGLASVLSGAGVEIVGTSSPDANAAWRSVHMDVTLVDLQAELGPDDVQTIAAGQPHAKVVALGPDASPERMAEFISAGAVAYLPNRSAVEDTVAAIRQVTRIPGFALMPLAAFEQRPTSIEADAMGLTRRELEIVSLLTRGLSNQELARMLWVTEQTVKFHLSNIYRKLDVRNRTEATAWAAAHGLADSTVESAA
jgi:DNA-binding NarL/FixJ family response regulator